MRHFQILIPLVLALLIATDALAQKSSSLNSELGIFTDSGNIGAVRLAGGVEYVSSTGTYRIAGGGENMWGAKDQCHMVWKKLKGDFILRCRCKFIVGGGDRFRKIGWMIRSDLDTDSAHVDIAVHGDGLTSMQYRREKGDKTRQVKSERLAANVIQLERRGTNFIASVAKVGKPFSVSRLNKIDLGDEVYVGLFVCSHNQKKIEKALFNNVRIIRPVPDKFEPYKDYFASNLEVMEYRTGRRKIVRTTSDSMQSPTWTADGGALTYTRNGALEKLNLRSGASSKVEFKLSPNISDHVRSFDGKQIGFSHSGTDHDGKAMIYTMPAEGGEPKLVTKLGPSYLHGWSPDGRSMVYTGEREEKFDIYKTRISGGDEIRLTDAKGHNDGAEFSPDGKHIFFNSNRTGNMEIWRMNADGSDQKQLTDDKFQYWFPHVSPDGKTIVFLAFAKDVPSADLPFYRHVYLCEMPSKGGRVKIVAYLYGGQGSINVPCWSPDGRRIAFISNTARIEK